MRGASQFIILIHLNLRELTWPSSCSHFVSTTCTVLPYLLFVTQDVDECVVDSPCHTNATCENTIGSYTCSCDDGYSGNGTSCTEDNECDLNLCEQGATCADLVNDYSCNCTGTGYKGKVSRRGQVKACALFVLIQDFRWSSFLSTRYRPF